ncbi:MAG: ATP-grasp domain-containing protein [Proteobacteria bacterium]|nr:ATP-grasp domain-containing protein [Pseudomonadota bacterium]
MYMWVLEENVYHDNDSRLAKAARSNGHTVIAWNDDWWTSSGCPDLSGGPVVFHGSLGNAARIAKELPWNPGAYCDVAAFECTSWYERASKWLVHDKWVAVKAQQFVADPKKTLDEIESKGNFFVRPNSPLKPFSGRVLNVSALSMEALDHGFYYDDPDILVIVSPTRKINAEWRFVAVKNKVIAASSYVAETRSEIPIEAGSSTWEYAKKIAQSLQAPQDVWVMDICATEDGLGLLELNPFSGADLYACDRNAIVLSIADLFS